MEVDGAVGPRGVEFSGDDSEDDLAEVEALQPILARDELCIGR